MAARKTGRRSRPAAYLIVGEDSFLREQFREQIIAAHVPEEARAFGVTRFSLARTALAEVLRAAAMRPLLSPGQVLVLNDVETLKDEELAYLEEYLEAPADFTVLIFEEVTLDRRTRVARLLEEKSEVYLAESPEGRGAFEAVEQFARELKLKISRETAEELVFVVGPEQGRLRAELEKLRAYVGQRGEVTSDDVAAVVSPARKFKVFDLVELLAERRRAAALARLRRLLEAGESPIGIVGLLAWLYRQLLIAQALPPGTPEWKAAQSLRAPRARVPALLRQARKFSPADLREALTALQEADVTLKSSPPHPVAVMEMLVAWLTRSRATAEKA